MKSNCLTILSVFSFIVFFFTAKSAFSDLTDGFLDNNINFEEIFSDLPQNFDLESATVFELGSLPYFTSESAQNVLNFRDTLGGGVKFLEKLWNIPGISPIQFAILNHLLEMKKAQLFPVFSGYIRTGFLSKPDEEKFSEGKYYLKLHGENEKSLHFTILGERDSFEPRAFDLYSANLSIKLDKARTHIIIGDYRPEIGQGLVFSRYSRSYINGTHVVTNEKKTIENTFFEEALYLRGIYLKIRKGRITTRFWSSFKNLDATLDEKGEAIHIKTTGYHYPGTPRNNLRENINCAQVSFNYRHGLKFGLAGVVTNYSPPLTGQTGERYLNYPEGSHFDYVSLNGEYKKNSLVVFFEHALSGKKENATIGGIEIKNDRLRSCLLLRNYSEGYWAPNAGSFSSFGSTSNERGIYSAVQAELPYASRFLASMDLARTVSRTYFETMPKSRKRLSVMLNSQFSKGFAGKIVARSVDDSSDLEKRWNCRIYLKKKRKVIMYWGGVHNLLGLKAKAKEDLILKLLYFQIGISSHLIVLSDFLIFHLMMQGFTVMSMMSRGED
ncbi:MAG TPA: hypothetical protein ENH82_07520 [bacterium]|nr:hypothetical protein [bacterium]